MKKIYILLCVVSLALTSSAQDGKVLSLSVYDLTNTSLNKSYIDSQGNVIKFSTNEPTFKGDQTFFYTESVDNPLSCIGKTSTTPPVGTKYSMATIQGHSTAGVENSPFILIEVAGDNNVLEVELLGYATSGGGHAGAEAELICAFSSSSDPTDDDSFMINLDYENPLLQFKQADCATENTRELPADTKFIKLISIDSFGWSGVMSYACKPQIHAINIYSKDIGSSIDENDQETLTIQIHGRNLQLSEFADVTIYDITGKSAAQYSDIDNTYLDTLDAGIYVIKATNKNGQNTAQKVVIR